MMQNDFGGMGFGFFHGVGGPFMLIFWVLLLIGIIWLLKSIFTSISYPADREIPSAREMLNQRFARGEIDRATYLQMCEDLKGKPL